MTHYMMDLFLKPAYKVNYKAGKPTKSEQEKFISVTEYEILKRSRQKEENSFIISAIHNDLYGLSCQWCKKYKD